MTSAPQRGVAEHLGIQVAEYDRAIRSFIPHYQTMLRIAARALKSRARGAELIVDLGIGSGALTRCCLQELPRARVIGIDADAAMLKLAEARLASRAVELRHANFARGALPRADVFIASLSLHHIRRVRKNTFYRRAFRALRSGGLLVSADCYPPMAAKDANLAMRGWRAHVRRSYGPRETSRLFQSWSQEDDYVPLEMEREMMSSAGFTVEIAWRQPPFAVIVGAK